jgi:hypothetical protein
VTLTRRWFVAGFGRVAAMAGAVGLLTSGGAVARELNDEKKPDVTPSRKDLEKKLAQQLTGAVFNGRFTVDGQPGDKLPNPEKYTILKATKLPDDFWLLESRIEYGGKDVTVPITLRIVWADDTPMITLTDLTIPNMGTFSSRILIHGDRYAGSWQHDKVGGHMWGKIESAQG